VSANPTENPRPTNGAEHEPTNSEQSAAQGATSAADTGAPRIADLEAQVKEKEAKYLYLYAEFENFKKRAVKERSETAKFGWEPVARELIGVLDNLDRALEHMPASTDANFAAGIRMVAGQFRATLMKQGVEEIKALDQAFDPNLHEAVGQEPSATLPQGHITREQQKGYTLHGRLLRPARVLVSMGNLSATGSAAT
jgi:molecular chaperone GrpE